MLSGAVRNIVEKYRNALGSGDAMRHDKPYATVHHSEHCRYLLSLIKEETPDHLVKLWLGQVQGFLFRENVYTADELARHADLIGSLQSNSCVVIYYAENGNVEVTFCQSPTIQMQLDRHKKASKAAATIDVLLVSSRDTYKLEPETTFKLVKQ